ncbi:MAG: LytR C-terminal domain-containing protein [Nocardioidaceae bacterium]
MALPSAVTLGSAAVIIATGVGLVAVTSMADEDRTTQSTSTTPPRTEPTTTTTTTGEEPTKPPKRDQERKQRKERNERKDRKDAVPKVFVEVYNNSGITGMAADTAASLEGAGWNVAATDNWYGAIPENTVYYPDELRTEARQLAKVLGYSRLRPAVAPMQFDRLTVIITSG